MCVRIIVDSSNPVKDYWLPDIIAHDLCISGKLIGIWAGQLHADRGLDPKTRLYFELNHETE
jgi:hypothetical protein